MSIANLCMMIGRPIFLIPYGRRLLSKGAFTRCSRGNREPKSSGSTDRQSTKTKAVTGMGLLVERVVIDRVIDPLSATDHWA